MCIADKADKSFNHLSMFFFYAYADTSFKAFGTSENIPISFGLSKSQLFLFHYIFR